MFRHVVLFRWIDGTTSEQVDAVARGLRALVDVIPEIASYECGPDLGVSDGTWDFAVVAGFADQADWLTYRDHPAHLAVIAEHIKPFLAERASAQLLP